MHCSLVLASIASERLADGLMLSLLFVLFSLNLGDQVLSENLFYVALLFGTATFLVVLTLVLRDPLFRMADLIAERLNHQVSHYTLNRIQVFVNGLSPLCTWSKLPVIVLWTIVIWSTELAVFYSVSQAYGGSLDLNHAVLFLVAVNFSSLIPAAPGGFGVIEAIASAVLISVGIGKEHALSMVFSQHLIQYIVVGIPGVLIMFSWKGKLKEMKAEKEAEDAAQ